MEDRGGYSSAVQDFRQARRRAALEAVLARLGGRPNELLPFDEVRKRLGGEAALPRGLQEIPLDSIVGSVGRYEDFSRQFLPRQEGSRGRWASVRSAVEDKGLPPIEVYQLGEVYFVIDGHHRVSVARQVGAKAIEAYVTEVASKAPLKPDDRIEDLIMRAEQAQLLKDTQFDELYPEVDLSLTEAGRYRELREHIAVHQYFMGLDQQRDVAFGEAAQHWMEEIYRPTARAIRRLGLLRDFPERTEADLYLWLVKHRSELVEQLGWELAPEEAAADLLGRFSRRPARALRRIWERLVRLLTPGELETGPKPGEWRRERVASPDPQHLFNRVLVAVSGEPNGWQAVEQAILVAGRERGRVRGVHVQAKTDASQAAAIQQEFEGRLKAADLPGKLVLEEGQVSDGLEKRARWSDLLVVHLQHPPGSDPIQRLRSGMRAIVQRSPRPLLIVSKTSRMEHALLAYDGSPKAREALYMAAYMGARWRCALTVLAAGERAKARRTAIFEAKQYLSKRGVAAEFVERQGRAGEQILQLAEERECDFIVMGGYGAAPLVEVVVGSTVDEVLRGFRGPVLISR